MRKYNKHFTLLLSLVLLLNVFASSYVFADENQNNLNNDEIVESIEKNDNLTQNIDEENKNTLKDENDKDILNVNLDSDGIAENETNFIEESNTEFEDINMIQTINPQAYISKASSANIKGIDMEVKNDVVQVNENNTANALIKSGAYGQDMENTIFGLAGNFFLTGFESVKISGHSDGNVLTKNLVNNTNFGSSFPNEFSYIEEQISGNNKDFVKINSAVLVLGKAFNVSYDANMWSINNQKINSPQHSSGQYNIWQDNERKFVDLNELEREMINLSNDFSNIKTTSNIRFVTDQNELNSIGMNGVKKAFVLPNTNEKFSSYTTDIDTLGTGKIGITKFTRPDDTFILNIDAKGKSSISLPSVVYSYNGSISTNGEVSSPRPGNVIVNVFDSTKADRMFTGRITTGTENNMFLISPKADVKISAQFNGIIIAKNIESSGTEIHRDKPTSPTNPPKPEEEFIKIPVTKKWVNSNGDELTREVKLILYGDGEKVKELTLKAPNWTGDFTNLPKYKKGTKTPIKYTIKEVTIDGYEIDIKEDGNNGFIVTNTKTEEPIEFVNLSIEKLWNDELGNILDNIIDKNGNVIEEITLELFDGDTKEVIQEFKLTKKNNWKLTIDKLPKYKKGTNVLIKYSIKELSQIPGFELVKLTNNLNYNFSLTNKKLPVIPEIKKINIPVEKLWKVEDENTIKDLIVEVKLLENGTFNGKTIKLTKDNNWKGEFKDLPTKTSDGKDITYTIEEINIPGFDKGLGGNQDTGFTLINAERPVTPPEEFKINIPVNKLWKVEDINTIKDLVVEVKLLENGVFNGKTIKLTKENNWKGEFKDLPTKTSDGKDIIYTIEEINIPGFDKGLGGNQDTGFTLINAERPVTPPEKAEINIPIEKKWVVKDENTIKDLVVEVKLLENGTFNGRTIKLTKATNWKGEFKNLTTRDTNGDFIKYTIEEIDIPGFDKGAGGNQLDGFKLINAERPVTPPEEFKINIPVEKLWKVKDINTIKDLVVEVKLLENGTFNGKIIKLTKDNNWKGEFKDLPTKTNDGKDIVYTIEEINIPGFDKGLGGNQDTGFTLINAERPVTPPEEFKINIPVEKIWKVEDVNTIKDLVVEVKLLENGTFNGKTIKLTKDNNWKGEFKDLPTKTNDGKDIIYIIEETDIPGFDKGLGGNQDTGFTLINAEKPVTPPEKTRVNIPIKKVWKVNSENTIKDLVVEVKLLENGKFNGKTIKLTKDTSWKGEFKDLPTLVDGKFVKYTIEEINIPGFDKELAGNVNDGFVLTNSEKPDKPNPDKDKTNVSVNKTWKDDKGNIINGNDTNRSITIRLFADGKEVDKVVLSKGSWSHTFRDLPKYQADGKTLIKYIIREDSVSGYNQTITGSAENGFEIINKERPDDPNPKRPKEPKDPKPKDPTPKQPKPKEPKPDDPDRIEWEKYNPEYVDIPVVKYWVGKAGKSVTINLLADGVTIDSIILNDANDWTYEFEDLPLLDTATSTMINYTVEETPITGYTSLVDGDFHDGFIITNTEVKEPIKPKTPTDNPQTFKDGISRTIITIGMIAVLLFLLERLKRFLSK